MKAQVDSRYFLLHLTRDQMTVDVEGNTVKDCLDQLVAAYPDVARWLYTKSGQLAPYISLHVNLDSVTPNELSDPIRDGDVLYVVLRYH